MRSMRVVLAVFVLAGAVCAQLPRVLFLTHSAGFVHPVVERVAAGRKALAERALREYVGREFEVVATQDCAAISADGLRDVAAVVFYTTGELPIDAAGRQALFDFVRRGGAFVGVHSATDTFYGQPDYGEMIGGYFDGHPWNQSVGVRVEDRTHPAVARLGGRFELHDEIYQFKAFSRERVQVLLSLDPLSVDLAKGKRDDGDYALAWCRDFGQGRVFYTALGHRPEVWADARFLEHLAAGLRWAIGDARRGRAPAGATVLFDGEDVSSWMRKGGAEAIGWTVDDGLLVCKPGTGSIVTRRPFGSVRLHVEFRLPQSPAGATEQNRANSGVYVQERYEVQILDSHGLATRIDGCAALYRKRAPDVNVCAAPGEWQSYDIWFTAPGFSEAGEKTQNARFTVIHNGVLVHDRVELDSKTGAGQPEGPAPGRLLLQDHGHAVAFRNLWLVEG